MNEFHNQFSPDSDPDMAEYRRVWTTKKPLLRDSVVKFAPPYPDYPKRKSRGASSDPSSASAREFGEGVEVAMHNNINGFGDFQEVAWNCLVENTGEIESALRHKLFAMHIKNLEQFQEEVLANDPRAQKYWAQIRDEIDWKDLSAVNHLYKLVGIGLLDEGLDDCGFTSYEFQTGWDQDHGTSILMHRCSVLIAGGMSEYIYFQSSLIPSIKAVQAYDLDDGDMRLI